MSNAVANWVIATFSRWLLQEQPYSSGAYLTNFEDVCRHIQPGDIILMEGHNRIGTIIRHITQSVWTHAALYVGRLQDITDPVIREMARKKGGANAEGQFLVESEIGSGTVIMPLSEYENEHIRLLRPHGLTREDAQQVIDFAIGRLGMEYDIRQILDLARFLFPWGLYPRRWRSTLFQHNAQQPTHDICSSMIADAFQSVDFPILPLVEAGYLNRIEFVRRNNRLYTPADFDFSPYFDVIKYPSFPLDKPGAYRDLPWRNDVVSDDEGAKIAFLSPNVQQFFSAKAYAVVGASVNRNKFGNKVLRCYMQNKMRVYPVNHQEKMIEGIACVSSVAALPSSVNSISVVTPPAVTETIVEQAIKKGIMNIWMQPGAESAEAIRQCEKHHINVIADGKCILQELGFHEEAMHG